MGTPRQQGVLLVKENRPCVWSVIEKKINNRHIRPESTVTLEVLWFVVGLEPQLDPGLVERRLVEIGTPVDTGEQCSLADSRFGAEGCTLTASQPAAAAAATCRLALAKSAKFAPLSAIANVLWPGPTSRPPICTERVIGVQLAGMRRASAGGGYLA